MSVPIVVATDCKSLWDAAQKVSPVLGEQRTLIDLLSIKEGLEEHGNVALVSLGDLGESKSVRPEETAELFSGTTECHRMAAEYLGSFGVPYEVIGGNHDLEVGAPP